MSGRVSNAGSFSFPLTVTPYGAREYNAARKGVCTCPERGRNGPRNGVGGRVQETGGAAEWLGPLARTGSDSVLYLDSWTAAQPPRFAPPPLTASGEDPVRLVSEIGTGCRGQGVVSLNGATMSSGSETR